MFRFAATEITDLIFDTYCSSSRQQGLWDRAFITRITPAFVVLAATSLWYALSYIKTGIYKPTSEFSSDREAGGE